MIMGASPPWVVRRDCFNTMMDTISICDGNWEVVLAYSLKSTTLFYKFSLLAMSHVSIYKMIQSSMCCKLHYIMHHNPF